MQTKAIIPSKTDMNATFDSTLSLGYLIFQTAYARFDRLNWHGILPAIFLTYLIMQDFLSRYQNKPYTKEKPLVTKHARNLRTWKYTL